MNPLMLLVMALAVAFAMAADIVVRLSNPPPAPPAPAAAARLHVAPLPAAGPSTALPAPPAVTAAAVRMPAPGAVTVPSARLDEAQFELLAALNAVRVAAGAAPLAEDARLSQAAADHAAYLAANRLRTHEQSPALPRYTARDPVARVALHRYPAASHGVSENYVVRTDSARGCVDWLVRTLYHLGVVVAPDWHDVGVAFDGQVCVIAYARPVGAEPLPPADAPVVYPASGAREVATGFEPALEHPDPAPDLAQVGQPVLISLASRTVPRPGPGDLEVDSFTLEPHDAAGDGALAARLIAAPHVRGSATAALTADPLVRDDQVFLLPLAPLAPGATYTARFSGRVRGAPVTRTWSFTTAG